MPALRPLAAFALIVATPVSAQQATVPASAPAAVPAALPGAKIAPASTGPGQVSKNAPINGVLTLFGNERCPTNSDGDEIVVCVRRSAREQFRIPKELREFEVTPQNQSWALRVKENQDAGATGIGSCSTVGPGGGTGCFVQNARRSTADTKAREKAATPDLP